MLSNEIIRTLKIAAEGTVNSLEVKEGKVTYRFLFDRDGNKAIIYYGYEYGSDSGLFHNYDYVSGEKRLYALWNGEELAIDDSRLIGRIAELPEDALLLEDLEDEYNKEVYDCIRSKLESSEIDVYDGEINDRVVRKAVLFGEDQGNLVDYAVGKEYSGAELVTNQDLLDVFMGYKGLDSVAEEVISIKEYEAKIAWKKKLEKLASEPENWVTDWEKRMADAIHGLDAKWVVCRFEDEDSAAEGKVSLESLKYNLQSGRGIDYCDFDTRTNGKRIMKHFNSRGLGLELVATISYKGKVIYER